MSDNITILGEDRFFYHKEDDGIWVTHAKWSMVGWGETLPEAINDIINLALFIKDSYVKCEDSELSEEAIKLKHWLAPIQKTESQ